VLLLRTNHAARCRIGAHSRLFTFAKLDKRRKEAWFMQRVRKNLAEHVGGNPSHLIENDPRQYHHVPDFTALNAFPQVTGLAEADAHLLSADLSEARLKLANDLWHTGF
jgi:hypothetical protein